MCNKIILWIFIFSPLILTVRLDNTETEKSIPLNNNDDLAETTISFGIRSFTAEVTTPTEKPRTLSTTLKNDEQQSTIPAKALDTEISTENSHMESSVSDKSETSRILRNSKLSRNFTQATAITEKQIEQESTDERPPVSPVSSSASWLLTEVAASSKTTDTPTSIRISNEQSNDSVVISLSKSSEQAQTTLSTSADSSTAEPMINDIHIEKKLDNGLYRIKLAEIITDEFTGIGGRPDDTSDSDNFQRTSQFIEGSDQNVNLHKSNVNDVTHHRPSQLKDINESENDGKINIIDLYPSKLEDFSPIIRESNERMIKEKKIYLSDDKNDFPNSLMNPIFEASDSDTGGAGSAPVNIPTSKIEIELIEDTKMAGERNSPAAASKSTLEKTTDFTGQLQQQDGVITEIEKSFKLDDIKTTPHTSTATPAFSVNHKIEFIDRRVKKNDPFLSKFKFYNSAAADTPLGRIDFANTKFNTDSATSPRAERKGSAGGGGIGNGNQHAEHFDKPEFSTTKFYNSKELYSEMLHKKLVDSDNNGMINGSPWAPARKSSTVRATTQQTEVSLTRAKTATTTLENDQRHTSTIAAGDLDIVNTAKNKSLKDFQIKNVKSINYGSTTLSSSANIEKLSSSSAPDPPPSIKIGKTNDIEASSIGRVKLFSPSDDTERENFEQVREVTKGLSAGNVMDTPRPPLTEQGKRKWIKANKTAGKVLSLLSTGSNRLTTLTTSFPTITTKTTTDQHITTTLITKGPVVETISSEKSIVSSTSNSEGGISSSSLDTTTIAPSSSSSAAETILTTNIIADDVSVSSYPSILASSTILSGSRNTLKASTSAPSITTTTAIRKSFSRPRILTRLQEKINSLECDIQNVPQDSHLWRGNETHELLLPITTPEDCATTVDCLPMIISWEGQAEIQSGDVLLVEINDALLIPNDLNQTLNANAHKATTAVYQVTRPGHEHCDVTEGVLLDITPLVVDGKKLVTLYDKDLTEGINLLIVVSELWGSRCVRLKVTVKSDNCGDNADCSGKGVCFSNASMEGYECQCCSGFAGSHCEEIDACSPSPCTNNGICVDLSQGHEGNAYQCLCPYGYTGKNCQYESDPCNPTECMNGGSCIGNSTHFRCDCAPGYTGPLCQHNLNECESSPCVHGICVDQEDGFRCFCQPGFAGELCNFEYNECESNPCLNGGQCNDQIGGFECKCTRGYTGKRCHVKVDFCANQPCPEGHRCIDRGDEFTCECPGGRNGPECNQVPRTLCNVNPCANGGTCWTSEESFYCACRPGYTGKMCEDEFVVETVVSSSEFMTDDVNARGAFNDKSFGSGVTKGPIELHNAYIAAITLAAAIFIVAIVVTICHCKVHQTYRRFSSRHHQLIPIFSFARRPKSPKSHRHWLSGKGGSGNGGSLNGSTGNLTGLIKSNKNHLPGNGGSQCNHHMGNSCGTPSAGLHHTTSSTTAGSQHNNNTHPGQGRPFQRHLAMNLENDMYYTVDFSESQHSPLIQ